MFVAHSLEVSYIFGSSVAIIYFQDVNSCEAVFGLYDTKPSVVQKGLELGDFRVLLPGWFELVS